ncbi:4908_t:CDS:10 [Dentiscutata erythropus]|uniref:Dolichyl-phosphate-mannose--protein mannosyltransferase n=1 Tax=Dentiscutata erythropus TaxID=1348616 RepID=A0A9N9HFY7_9GLOM|nr:4908_t:CDS:10 [Dentiscutata erythropus]
MISIHFDDDYNDNNDDYLPNSSQTNNDCLEMDTLKRRHFTTTINQQQFSKAGYEQVPLDPIDFDENGKLYKPIRLPKNKILAFWQQNNDIIIPAFFTLLSFWTRYYLISYSNFVVWDEAHFGKFGSHYLKREFYFDVHPPLGKVLVGLAGLLAGYNGSFEFGSGETYPEDINYPFMRIFFATFGAWMVPLAYFTALELNFSQHAVILTTLMVLLDTAYLCISRFILLDSMLLFFTFTTVFFLTKFHNQRDDPFSIDWWLWLILTGVSIGCVTSVKWVGCFVTALVGLYTIEDFGPGDAQMSSLFQAGLRGNNFHGNPIELAYGSRFTLKNMGYGGGLLHSHVQTFPTGSKQQQVTCYHHRDTNNDWIIKKIREEHEENSTVVEFVKHNDEVRLFHASTKRNLHSHQVNAPVTKSQYEVSCYGNDELGDQNDNWIVEVVDDLLENTPHIRALTTRLRFRHKILGCYLRAANTILPQWGFKQIEVTCDKKDNPHDSHTHWNIEHHWNDKLPPGGGSHYRTMFLHDFWHLNVAMYTTNNALIPDPDKEDILASHPWQWPILQVGIRICGWDDNAVKYYLLGNPIIWWSAQWTHFLYVGKISFIGWLLHFLPFFIMGRVTYLHHYFPALYFSILMCAFMLDHFTSSCNPIIKHAIFGISYLAVISVFLYFKDIAFGFDYPSRELKGRQWFSTWNLID